MPKAAKMNLWKRILYVYNWFRACVDFRAWPWKIPSWVWDQEKWELYQRAFAKKKEYDRKRNAMRR